MYHLTVGIPTSWGCQQLGPYLHERGPCRSATNSPGGVTFSLGYNGRANFNWLGYLYTNVGGCKPSWRCSSLLMLPMIGSGWTIPRAVQDTFCWYSMVCWLYWHASDKVEICEHWRREQFPSFEDVTLFEMLYERIPSKFFTQLRHIFVHDDFFWPCSCPMPLRGLGAKKEAQVWGFRLDALVMIWKVFKSH